MRSKPLARALLIASGAALALTPLLKGAPPACDPDNGGITLPPGFCAMVVADDLGTARHLAVAQNGDLYVALQRGPGGGGRGQAAPGGIVALHDADGDGRVKEMIASESTTGVALRNGYLSIARRPGANASKSRLPIHDRRTPIGRMP